MSNKRSVLRRSAAAACLNALIVAGAAIFGLCLGFDAARAQDGGGGEPGKFDYYLLVLSWSPSYCETQGRDRHDQECSGARPYAFVLHGLWPQYEGHGYPDRCDIGERPWVPRNVIDGMLDIMPSPRLVIHEYQAHGTCSGMEPQNYFDSARRAFQSIRIPDRFKDLAEPASVAPSAIADAFLAANPQLQPDMIEVSCSRDRLRDVRICLTKDLKPRKCGEGESGRRLCRSASVTLPPVRGGGFGRHGEPSGQGS